MEGGFDMCGIFGTYDRNKIQELAEANSERGQYGWSVTLFEENKGKLTAMNSLSGLGEFPKDVKLPKALYYLCHIRAATSGGENEISLHPAKFLFNSLWHNGIIKAASLEKYAEAVGDCPWDTLLFLSELILSEKRGLKLDQILSTTQGSFACCFYSSGSLRVFRNELAPLYIDADMNISSTSFCNSEEIKAFKIFNFDIIGRTFLETGSFSCTSPTYYGIDYP